MLQRKDSITLSNIIKINEYHEGKIYPGHFGYPVLHLFLWLAIVTIRLQTTVRTPRNCHLSKPIMPIPIINPHLKGKQEWLA